MPSSSLHDPGQLSSRSRIQTLYSWEKWLAFFGSVHELDQQHGIEHTIETADPCPISVWKNCVLNGVSGVDLLQPGISLYVVPVPHGIGDRRSNNVRELQSRELMRLMKCDWFGQGIRKKLSPAANFDIFFLSAVANVPCERLLDLLKWLRRVANHPHSVQGFAPGRKKSIKARAREIEHPAPCGVSPS